MQLGGRVLSFPPGKSFLGKGWHTGIHLCWELTQWTLNNFCKGGIVYEERTRKIHKKFCVQNDNGCPQQKVNLGFSQPKGISEAWVVWFLTAVLNSFCNYNLSSILLTFLEILKWKCAISLVSYSSFIPVTNTNWQILACSAVVLWARHLHFSLNKLFTKRKKKVPLLNICAKSHSSDSNKL